MNIYSKPGTKVRFNESCEAQTRWGANDEANDYLVKDQEYTVDHIEVHNQHTKVYLTEFPGKKFNSCVFY